MDKIKELENKIKNIQEELEELKNKEKCEWILEVGDEYYYYDKDIETVERNIWYDDSTDHIRKANKVIFKTEEEAEEYADYISAKRRYTYNFTREEWKKENILKYYIYLYGNGLKTDWLIKTQINSFYFKTEEMAQEFIDKYKKQILKYEFNIEEE